MPSVLFVCTANQFRSPLAAAFFTKELHARGLADGWIVESAGTWAEDDEPVSELALHFARKYDLAGLENHQTRHLTHELLSRFDLCLVMEAGHKEALWAEFPMFRNRVYMLSEAARGIQLDVLDPAKPNVNPNEAMRDLKMFISNSADQLIRLAQSLSGQG